MNLVHFFAGVGMGIAVTAIYDGLRLLREPFTPAIDEPDPADDAIGDQPAIPGARTVSYTYLLMDEGGKVAPGQIEYDDPAEVHRHWVGPIVKVTREWGAES